MEEGNSSFKMDRNIKDSSSKGKSMALALTSGQMEIAIKDILMRTKDRV